MTDLPQPLTQTATDVSKTGGKSVRARKGISPKTRFKRREIEKPHLKRLYYIRATVRNRTDCLLDIAYLEHLADLGICLDWLEQAAKLTDGIEQIVDITMKWAAHKGHPWERGVPWS